jgi:hypothetical protein
MPYYRQIYAAIMLEAGNPDAKFTIKSAVYQAAFAAIYEGGSIYDLVDKLCRAIPDFAEPTDGFMAHLGSKRCA